MDKESPEEALAKVKMEKIEEEKLNEVFNILRAMDPKKSEDQRDKISPNDIAVLIADMIK